MDRTDRRSQPPPDRYVRQRLFPPLGAEGDARLRGRRALIVGCGALGSHLATFLVRAGVGHVRLVDRDVVEWSNLHRQVEFTEEDAAQGLPKAAALANHLAQANSQVNIEPVVKDFNARSARGLAQGMEIYLDGSDNLPTRFLLNELSLAEKVPWVYGGAIGDEAHALLFVPGRGPCLRCVLPDLPQAGALATCDTAGVLGPAAGAAASFQAALALHCLARPEEGPELAGRWVRLRLWDLAAATTQVSADPECRTCGLGQLEFLDPAEGEGAVLLCGRGAVQVLPGAPKSAAGLDLAALADRLKPLGAVEWKGILLRFKPADHPATLTVFGDGRAIIERIEDLGQARALYDRYVGQ
ncbi:MAG: ThiF family adenylyltransferase [Planctomycetes bacterium]|nr:ThiF family adenylyltransferase [Planctomycetota bacterium]